MYDITIIGGGPVGMFASFYAGLRNAKVQLIESLPELGGQVQALYPEKQIHDIAGYPKIKGRELIAQLKAQMAEFPIDIHLHTEVTNVSGAAGDFTITTNHGTSHSKAVIVAVGSGAFQPRRLAVDNAAQFENHQLLYHVPDLVTFKDKRVMVAGGGDSAIDMALMLEPVAKQVYVMHRRNQFRGMEHAVDQLKASSVAIKTPFLVKELAQADDDSLTVTMKKVRGDGEEQVGVDYLLVNYGFIADNKVLRGWDVEFEQAHRALIVDSAMQTSIPGIYAIGDTNTYTGKLDLIASGFGEAPAAVFAIMSALYPDKRSPLHSTTLFEKLGK